jgi:hypothetical protein
MDLHSKLEYSNFEFSAIDIKVVIRQLFIDAANKCSGDQIPAIPLGNSGGVATSIVCGKTGELKSPFLVPVHFKFTS